jgi:hypothetical protein
MRPGPALVSVTAVLLIGVSIFLINQEYSGQKTIIAETQTRENIVPLDPSKPIYVPTDDLLQVNVLRYEYQWATFAYYDPITMEIR